MTYRLPRLPPTIVTRTRISNAMRGRTLSPEHREALSKAHHGRKLSPEHREAIARGRRGETSDEMRERRARERKEHRRRVEAQFYVDLTAALAMKRTDLYLDVLQSKGYRDARALFDTEGKVSDGLDRYR